MRRGAPLREPGAGTVWRVPAALTSTPGRARGRSRPPRVPRAFQSRLCPDAAGDGRRRVPAPAPRAPSPGRRGNRLLRSGPGRGRWKGPRGRASPPAGRVLSRGVSGVDPGTCPGENRGSRPPAPQGGPHWVVTSSQSSRIEVSSGVGTRLQSVSGGLTSPAAGWADPGRGPSAFGLLGSLKKLGRNGGGRGPVAGHMTQLDGGACPPTPPTHPHNNHHLRALLRGLQ